MRTKLIKDKAKSKALKKVREKSLCITRIERIRKAVSKDLEFLYRK